MLVSTRRFLREYVSRPNVYVSSTMSHGLPPNAAFSGWFGSSTFTVIG